MLTLLAILPIFIIGFETYYLISVRESSKKSLVQSDLSLSPENQASIESENMIDKNEVSFIYLKDTAGLVEGSARLVYQGVVQTLGNTEKSLGNGAPTEVFQVILVSTNAENQKNPEFYFTQEQKAYTTVFEVENGVQTSLTLDDLKVGNTIRIEINADLTKGYSNLAGIEIERINE